MKKVIITGGLGNQMFQYAFVLALRTKGINVKLDISYYDYWKKYNWKMHNGYELEKVFGIKENCINKQGLHMKWLRLLDHYDPMGIIKKDNLRFNKHFSKSLSLYYYGYWQNEKYFASIKEDVHKTFTFQGIDNKNQDLAFQLQTCNSVSLHIRRGDYSQFGMTILNRDYYEKAIKYIENKIDDPYYFLFSDDINEAELLASQMNIKHYKIIDHNKGEDSYKDMFLMSKCRHNIIANSTFSWWGAWLNTYQERIIIAPKIWDQKIVFFNPQPEQWILF